MCVEIRQRYCDNGKIKVNRIRIIHDTHQRKFFPFLIKIFHPSTNRLPTYYIQWHKKSYTSIYFSYFFNEKRQKRKTIVRDKMIPGHMDKDNKN